MSTAGNRSRQPPQTNPQQNQPQANAQNNEQNNQKKTKQKKIRKPITLKPQHFQTQKGLKKLYQLTNQIKWSDPMTTQSAMNLVVMTLKTWQSQMMPRYYYDYFLQRCQALGSDKFVTAYMHKVRRIHKGLDNWEISKPQNNPTQGNKNTEGVDLLNPIQNNQDYQAQIQQQQKFKQRQQLAKQIANTSLNKQNSNVKQSKNISNQEQIDQLMDEDLRMFEQMNRRKNMKNGKQQENKQYKSNDYDQDQDRGQDLGGQSGMMNDYDDYD